MATGDTVTRLRAELARLDGPARVGPLLRLGQALFERYCRAGPGQPAALPELNASIEALDEAYRLVDLTDPVRGSVAGFLGYALAARHAAHAGAERDRETGIHVLDEALRFPNVPPVMATTCRLMLAQLYFMRAVQGLQSPDFAMAAVQGGPSAASVSDADRAVDHLREVLTGPRISAEITAVAEQLLVMAEAVQSILGGLGGGVAGFDFGRMMQAMTGLQKIQDQFRGRFTTGFGDGVPPPAGLLKLPFPNAEAMAAADPLDRPVAVVHGAESLTGQPAAERPAATPTMLRDEPGELRRKLHAGLASLVEDRELPGPIWSVAAAALSGPEPPVSVVDESVALAAILVDDPDPNPLLAATDLFLLAVSLRLRARLDGGANADRRVGAESLVAAVRTIPPEHPAAVAMLTALGAFLDDESVLATIAGDVADRADVVIACGIPNGADLVTAHALRCLCRVAGGTATGTANGLDELDRAVATVPPEYAWLSELRTAAEAMRERNRT